MLASCPKRRAYLIIVGFGAEVLPWEFWGSGILAPTRPDRRVLSS